VENAEEALKNAQNQNTRRPDIIPEAQESGIPKQKPVSMFARSKTKKSALTISPTFQRKWGWQVCTAGREKSRAANSRRFGSSEKNEGNKRVKTARQKYEEVEADKGGGSHVAANSHKQKKRPTAAKYNARLAVGQVSE